ncbi:unnamed protein product [Heligmosomoides polygyrus]|uniref:Endonuclease-reverse transcriptase n=1 Tax=Heligmosomoides polygyrus TaxID=6339 RepID=A0A183F3I7_HELPZ|nr:unnamed protein product [Heligmosomoides polygyrus]
MIYRTVVQPIAMYGAECWPATKEAIMRLNVIETRMLRLTAGVTRMDRTDVIRQMFGVEPIADKMHTARLQWHGHVLRGKKTDRKIGLNFEVIKGRPKQRWSDTLHMNVKVIGVHPDLVLDRERWRHDIRIADPATKRD